MKSWSHSPHFYADDIAWGGDRRRAVDSEITKAAQEKNLPKGYHRKPSMKYNPLGLFPPHSCQPARLQCPLLQLCPPPAAVCPPSPHPHPPPPQGTEDFIPFRELLVFPGSGDDSFYSLESSLWPTHCFPYPPLLLKKNKRQHLVFRLESMLDYHTPYMAWAEGSLRFTQHFDMTFNSRIHLPSS